MEILIIALVIGCIPGAIAQSKGRSFVGWWIYGAALFVIALPHSLLLEARQPDRAPPSEPPPYVPPPQRATHTPTPPRPSEPTGLPAADATKICPMCAEQVKAAARICRFCRHEFPPEPQPPTPSGRYPTTIPGPIGSGPLAPLPADPTAPRRHMPFGMRECPACKELNWHDARNCTNCGVNLPPSNTG